MNALADLIPDFDENYHMSMVQGNMKAGMKEVDAQSRDLWMVRVDAIRVLPGFNVRVRNEKYEAVVANTAKSMEHVGFKPHFPLAGLVLRENGKNVIYMYGGHRRWEALQRVNAGCPKDKLKIPKVPMVIAPAGTSIEDITVDLHTGNTDGSLSLYEQGRVCKRLAGYLWEHERIGDEMNLEVPMVRDLLLLMSSPPEVRALVESDRMSATMAIGMLKQHGDRILQVLRRTEERAGNGRITNRFVPGVQYQKALKTQAPVMLTTLKAVQADPGFASLSEDNRAKLAELLAGLDKVEKEDVVDAAPDAANDDTAPATNGAGANSFNGQAASA